MPTGEHIRSKNGDLFIVIKEGRKIALGLVARGDHRAIKLGYFFPIELLDRSPNPETLIIDPREAIYIAKFGYLEIRNGNWPIIGHLHDFSRNDWPMPKFEVYPRGLNWHQIVEYDEDKLEETLSVSHIQDLPEEYDLSFIVPGGLAGAQYVENVLEQIVNGGREIIQYFRDDKGGRTLH